MYIWIIISISWRLHVSEFCVSSVSCLVPAGFDVATGLPVFTLVPWAMSYATEPAWSKGKSTLQYLILVLQVHLKTEFSNIFWSSLIFRRPHHAPLRPLRDQRDGNSYFTSTFAPSTLHAFCVGSYGRLLKARESCETDVLELASSIFWRWCW
jgi:hypothetical protein